IGFEALGAGVEPISIARARQALDSDAAQNRQLKLARVRAEIIRHLVFGRKRKCRSRKFHSGEAVVLGRRKQPKRVPTLTPGVAPQTARARAGGESDEWPPWAGQEVPDGKARLAPADHDRMKAFPSRFLHHGYLVDQWYRAAVLLGTQTTQFNGSSRFAR